MSSALVLIAELEAVLHTASAAQRLAIMHRLIDLFVAQAEAYSGDQLAVFDAVFGCLAEKAERPELAELSGRLAAVANAPASVINRLARHEDIAISGPVLNASSGLTEQTLAEIARGKGEKHLAAIAGRAQLGASVTDVLVDRCTGDVACKMAANRGASLSELGFVKLINRAKGDRSLAAAISSRPDVPPELQPFLELTLA